MRIAIVTGASSGIGREFALQIPELYKRLDGLWVVARRTERLKDLANQLDVPVRIFDGDLQRDYIYERIEKELDRQHADVRMLVNAAGYGKIGDVEELGAQEQYGMIDLNCKALTKMTKVCLPYMSNRSRIINVASSAAFAPQPGFAVYAATKSYVYSYSLALSAELKSRGILVTAVCPGPVDTEFFERAGALPNPLKASVKADASHVVRKALEDAVKGRRVSVYGAAMKSARIAAKVLPHAMIADLMKLANNMSK